MGELLTDGPNWRIELIAWAGGDPNQHQVGTMELGIPFKIHQIHGLLDKPTILPHGWRIMKIRDLADEMETNTKVSYVSKDVSHYRSTIPVWRLHTGVSLKTRSLY